MAIRYNVTHYYFREPNSISEYEYVDLKSKLQNNPDFSLIDPKDTITNQFGLLFKFSIGTVISIIIFLILIVNQDAIRDSWFWVLLLVITSLWSVFGFFLFLTSMVDLSSYAGFLRKKRKYFKAMENDIRKSKDYDDFFDTFYK